MRSIKINLIISGKVYQAANDNDTLEEDIEELEDLSMMDEDLDEDADEVPVSKEGMFSPI